MENRIYGKQVSIRGEDTRAFWDRRVGMAAERGSGAVLCGDQAAPDSAVRKDAYDREYILPRLHITKESRVLDVGCGIGRLAAMILPLCGFYCGTDFSGEMVKAAEEQCRRLEKETGGCGKFQFHPLSFSETMERGGSFFGGGFDVLIVCGVNAYINDETLKQGFLQMPDLLKPHAAIHFQEVIGLGERLTLDRFPSKELRTEYSAIYRTREEYLDLYEPLFQAGFSVAEEGMIPDYGNSHTDTDRWYIILRR